MATDISSVMLYERLQEDVVVRFRVAHSLIFVGSKNREPIPFRFYITETAFQHSDLIATSMKRMLDQSGDAGKWQMVSTGLAHYLQSAIGLIISGPFMQDGKKKRRPQSEVHVTAKYES